MPNGFVNVEVDPEMRPGERALPSTNVAMPAPAIHATGRHRGEGSRPVGKSRRTKVAVSPRPSPHPQLPIHGPYGLDFAASERKTAILPAE